MLATLRISRFYTRAIYTLFGFSLLVLTGCAFDTRQSTLDPKGPVAQVQLDLFWITVWVCVGIFVVTAGALLYVVIKYRERPGDENKPMPEQGHGNPLIEIGLIGVSVLLLVIIAVPTLEAIWYTHELPEDAENFEESKLGIWYGGDLAKEEKDEILEITAYGWQWWWSFEYPQFGITTANELALPVGKVVKINLRAVDVIHSFWLPKIAGKVDLIPGRANWMWIQADETGHYYGQCAEFCGEAHAYMLFRADVLTDADFTQWVKDYQAGATAPAGFTAQPDKEKPDPTARDDWMAWSQTVRKNPESLPANPVHEGAALFMGKGQCIVCHAIDNSPAMGQTGPNLTKVAARKSLGAGILDNTNLNGEIDPEKQLENLTEWVARSQHYKPGNLMYYRADAGLQNLKYNGVTFAGLQSVGIGKQNLRKAGAPPALVDAIAAQPNAPIRGVSVDVKGEAITLSQNQLKRAMAGLTDAQFARISDWPSREDFKKIAMFLQTLK